MRPACLRPLDLTVLHVKKIISSYFVARESVVGFLHKAASIHGAKQSTAQRCFRSPGGQRRVRSGRDEPCYANKGSLARWGVNRDARSPVSRAVVRRAGSCSGFWSRLGCGPLWPGCAGIQWRPPRSLPCELHPDAKNTPMTQRVTSPVRTGEGEEVVSR